MFNQNNTISINMTDEVSDTGDISALTEQDSHEDKKSPTPINEPIVDEVKLDIPYSTEIPELEKNLPINSIDNPQPTIFPFDESELAEHASKLALIESKELKLPQIKPFVNTQRLNELKDGYSITSFDKLGETKITENGFLLGGRKFLFATFTLPGKGKKLYVLATEAARVLNYRDSFILFLRNKSLYRLSCTDEERKFLEVSGFNISKIKSRQIAIVNARDLFISYGARVVVGGQRVIDDYWEEQISNQGFTKDSLVFPLAKEPKIRRKKKSNTIINKVTLVDPKLKLKLPTVLFVNPLPLLEDRKEYLTSTSDGVQSQVLPGQGITGSFELSSVASIPKYRNEGANPIKHKHLLSSLSTSNTPTTQVPTSAGNSLPIDSKLVGERAINGLPYYNPTIAKRISSEEFEKLKETEYLHGTVETNHLITVGRTQRNKQWKYYWQSKSGTPFGTTKENSEEFLKANEKFVNEIETETTYNEYLNCDQVISKKKKPNPNFLNHGTIIGLKPPYIDKPQNYQGLIPQHLQQGGLPIHMGMNQNIQALQQAQLQQQLQQQQQLHRGY